MESNSFASIIHFGYEVEYPLFLRQPDGYRKYASDVISELDPALYNYYNLHQDGGGTEFTTPRLDTYPQLYEEVEKIYNVIAGYLASDKDWFTDNRRFNSNESGVHIRIDVSKWSLVMQRRFMRLFSKEWRERSPAYIAWMETNVFRRSWDNWNHPFPYGSEWREIGSRNTTTKYYNVQYEHCTMGPDVKTIEIRGFGVCRNITDAITQIASVQKLCAIVDRSIVLTEGAEDLPIIDALYQACLDLYADERRLEWPDNDVDSVYAVNNYYEDWENE